MILAATFLAAACSLDKVPGDSIHTDESIESVEDCNKFLIGQYSGLKYVTTGAYIYATELQTDLFHAVKNFGNFDGDFYHYSVTASNNLAEEAWYGSYQSIANTNFLIEGIQKLQQSGKTLTSGANQLTSASKQVQSGASKIDSATSTLTSGAKQLSANSGALNSGASQLASGASQLSSGASQLASGASQLSSGTQQLSSGTGTLVSGSAQVKSGIGTLAKGAKELSDGTKKFNDEGIKKISDVVNDDLQDVLDRLDALRSDENAYTSYAGKSDKMDGNVKFVIETEAID